eukprot:554603_1
MWYILWYWLQQITYIRTFLHHRTDVNDPIFDVEILLIRSRNLMFYGCYCITFLSRTILDFSMEISFIKPRFNHLFGLIDLRRRDDYLRIMSRNCICAARCRSAKQWLCIHWLLIGALSWGLMEPIWKKLFSGTNTVYMKYIFIEEGLNKKYHIPMSGEVIGILLGVVFWVIVVVFEVLWPWQSELNTPNEAGCNFLSCGSWPPAISGLMVGLTQLPLMTVLGNVLGASSTYMCVMAQWLRLTTESVHDTFPQFKQQLSRRWQILFALAVVFGSWLGVVLNSNESNLNVAKHPYDEVEGVNEIRAIVGGFVLEFGSRMCKGCPSGHGFSGFMLLTTASFIAVPSIFAGGISTAFIIQAIGF